MNKTPDSPQILPKLKQLNSKRVFTPHIDLINSNSINIREIKKNDNTIKSFSSFMKHIVDSNNENFLTGEINIIEYIISKNTGIPLNEIKSLEKLSLKINKDFDILNQFGQYLPKLVELRLNFSGINSIEEIGSSFKNLKMLQITNCEMRELTGKIKYHFIGLICFQQLEVLDLSYNKISDLIEFEMCSSIYKLNLRNNLISDQENISFLSGMSSLKWLNLNENPIKKNNNYNEMIQDKLSQVEYIDKDEELFKSNSFLDETFLEEGLNTKNSMDCMYSTYILGANKTKSTIESNNSSRPTTATNSIIVPKQNFIDNRDNLTSSKFFIQGVRSLVNTKVKEDLSYELKSTNTNNEKNSYINKVEIVPKVRKASRDKSADNLKKSDETKRLPNNDSIKINKSKREDKNNNILNMVSFNERSKFDFQKNSLKKLESIHNTKIEQETTIFNKAFKKSDSVRIVIYLDNKIE